MATRSKRQRGEGEGKRVRDVIGPGLRVLFCGINPGRYSAAAGHHFAGPGNRFWPTLYGAGFTPRRLSHMEDGMLVEMGLGITNLVARMTAEAAELSREELVEGAAVLGRKVKKFGPRIVGFVGLSAYRVAFGAPKAVCGLQERTIGAARVWLLPNPSGRNAHHQGAALIELYRELRMFSEQIGS